MEAADPYKVPVPVYQTTRRHIPKGSNFVVEGAAVKTLELQNMDTLIPTIVTTLYGAV
jgi:hypothetical protein